MVSEKLLYTRWRYVMILPLIIFLTGAGYLLALDKYIQASLLFTGGLLTILIIQNLFDSTNKAIAYFFTALRNNDTTQQFPQVVKNKSLKTLYESMNTLVQHFQSIKIQSESNEKYYRTLIRHSATGLIVLTQDNRIDLINRNACQLAGISPDSTNPNLIKVKNPQFFEAICRIKPGEDSIYRHIHGNSIRILSFKATQVRKNGHLVKIISVQDIWHELESREFESYRKLISVLTHEIMNLMSPLTSVSKVLFSLYHRDHRDIRLDELDEHTLKTTLNSIQVIDEQSKGILSFIGNYRKISRIPHPVVKQFDVGEWIDQLRIVYAEKMKQNHIEFTIECEKQVSSIMADKGLLNQVLINLVNNAMDAVLENSENRRIGIELLTAPRNRTCIKVFNNGPFIPSELKEKIFVPFFTTKTNGSGIGLSISQEIVRLHRGTLMVTSSREAGTSFIMEF